MMLRKCDDGDQIGGVEDEVDFELCQLISTLVDRSAGTRERACRLRASSGCAQSGGWQIE
jgi:hypothetical protein